MVPNPIKGYNADYVIDIIEYDIFISINHNNHNN